MVIFNVLFIVKSYLRVTRTDPKWINIKINTSCKLINYLIKLKILNKKITHIHRETAHLLVTHPKIEWLKQKWIYLFQKEVLVVWFYFQWSANCFERGKLISYVFYTLKWLISKVLVCICYYFHENFDYSGFVIMAVIRIKISIISERRIIKGV